MSEKKNNKVHLYGYERRSTCQDLEAWLMLPVQVSFSKFTLWNVAYIFKIKFSDQKISDQIRNSAHYIK